MTWGSVDAFLAMGGYGFYVWGSYGVTLALLAAEAVAVIRRERTTIERVRAELARAQTR